MFSYLSSSSISLATVTPSLVTHPDGAGQLPNAAPHGVSCFLVKSDLLRSHSASLGEMVVFVFDVRKRAVP
jgi:hypothetical protein